MSPEQASRETVDFRSDQFSLGVLLYEMVTSKRPFEGASAAEILAAIVREQPIPVVRLNQEVPQPLQWIIERCLAKKPADRYGSTRELAQDLALVRDHLSEASLKTRGTAAPALPATVSSIVGRETDIVSVRSLFREGVRLLTLTGPGGNGKTRLALEIVKDLDKEYAGGVYFLALASVSRPELVVSTIAQAFGVWAEPGKPLPESVREQLASSLVDRTLLVLDNFEHVMAAAPFVGELLAACIRLDVLVTSREPLHIYGEQEWPVLPLRVPDIAHLPSFERICEYPALVLFVQEPKLLSRASR